MSNINFDNPWLLLIAVPLIVLFTVPFAIAVRKDNRNWHNITSQVLHVVLALMIGFAAAGTSVTTVLTETQVFVVADVSYSANKNLDTVDNIIKNELILPRNTKVGLITFGKEYELLGELGDKKNLPSVKTSTVDDSETNIAQALEYAASQFNDDVIKRVVLITDGKQTDEVDTYAMRRAVDSLRSRDIKVDAYFLDDNLSAKTPEVQISGAEFTASAFINHEEKVNVTVDTNCESRGSMLLFKNGSIISRRAITLSVGKNIVSFDLDTSTSGVYDYEVRLDGMDNDTSEYNNNYSFTQSVSSDLKVLIVTNNWDDAKFLIAQYEYAANIDVFENDTSVTPPQKSSYLATYKNSDTVHIYNFNTSIASDTAADYNMKIRTVPYSVEELVTYDEIVLADMDVRTLGSYKTTFVDSLEKVIGTYGKSLITIGNTYVQDDNTDKSLSKLDDMLPVRYGRTDDDPKLYTIVIDQSISMMNDDRLERAKEIATRIINILQDTDYVLVVGYWGENKRVYGPDPLTDTSKVLEAIAELEPKQGTSTLGGLTTAYSAIERLQYNKQLLLITDGGDGGNGTEDYKQQIYDLVEDNFLNHDVITSVFDTGSYINAAACQAFLKNIGNICDTGDGVSHYFSQDFGSGNGELDDGIFGDLAERENQKVFDNREAVVRAHTLTDEVLANFTTGEKNNLPQISGYITSIPRASATTVLQIDHVKQSGSVSEIPLYAHWNFGTGKVASFTSTVSGDWMKNWSNSRLDNGLNVQTAFLDNVLYTNIPAQKTDYPYTFTIIQDGTFTEVLLTPPSVANMSFSATATINLWMPDGEFITQELVRDGDHYFYDFSTAAVGRYEIEVIYAYNGAEYAASTVINVSYASEYDEFALFEASPLFRAINGRGQVVIDGQLLIENDPNEVGTYTNDFTLPLLIAAVALFVVDIVIRKLKWEDIVSFFGGYKNKTTGGNKQS